MHRSTWISTLLVASGLTIAGFASAGRPDRAPPRPAPAQDECRGEAARGWCPGAASGAPRREAVRR